MFVFFQLFSAIRNSYEKCPPLMPHQCKNWCAERFVSVWFWRSGRRRLCFPLAFWRSSITTCCKWWGQNHLVSVRGRVPDLQRSCMDKRGNETALWCLSDGV